MCIRDRDTSLQIDCGSVTEMHERFERAYRQRYGFFMPGKGVVLEAAAVEAVGKMDDVSPELVVQRESARGADANQRIDLHGG